MCGSWGAAPREREGKIRRLCRRYRWALVAVGLFAFVPAAVAADPPLPWAGGPAVETPFEAYAGKLATTVAARPVRVVCNGSGDWGQLASKQRFDPVTVWGFVVFDLDAATGAYRPADYMQLSEAACWYLDEYWRAPAAQKGKRCQVGTKVTFVERTTRLRVTARVKVKGRWVTKVSWVTERKQVPTSRPQYGACPDYQNRVFALQTISHEAQHLSGVRDEAVAECSGMQRLGWFAQQFGATAAQGRTMAEDYYTTFYALKRPGTMYYLPGCPNPGN